MVDGDPARLPSLVELLGNGDIHTIPAASGAEVSAALREQQIDGAVLGWNVPGLTGLDLLTALRDATGRGELRVLIYPAAPLSQADKDGIAAWDDAAVIQIASSPEDLLDKSMTMFHRKETDLPREKRDKLAAAHAVDQRLSGRKVLIVDDDLRNIFALTSALETHEMNLTLAENGRKGIEALRANPDVELVLMDIMMPEMDGFEAMRAIRKMPEYRELAGHCPDGESHEGGPGALYRGGRHRLHRQTGGDRSVAGPDARVASGSAEGVKESPSSGRGGAGGSACVADFLDSFEGAEAAFEGGKEEIRWAHRLCNLIHLPSTDPSWNG